MTRTRPRHDVVDRPVEEGIRVVLEALHAAADDASARLESAEDPEALHDFRVALRRLRSTLRAYRPWVGSVVGSRVEKKLKRCARATNAARDVEVQLAWLDRNEPALSDRDRPGAAALRAILRDGGEAVPMSRVLERYRSASERLRERLRHGAGRTTPGVQAERFGQIVATLLTCQLGIVLELARGIRSVRDGAAIHRTRIEAKRLRYVLEPFRGNRHADSREAVHRLRQLQDLLGELHDLDVLASWVRRARQEVDATSARPGLAAIERISAARRRALFGELDQSWRADGLLALTREVEVIAGALRARACESIVGTRRPDGKPRRGRTLRRRRNTRRGRNTRPARRTR